MQLQRDHLGRFAPGNRGGPGRPKGTRNPAYLLVVEKVVSLEDWRALLEKLKKSALQGERDALRFLAPYLLGRPAPAAPLEDENEDAHANALPPELFGAPAQFSASTIKNLSQQLEREKREYDKAIDNTTTKQPNEKKRT